MAILWRSLRLRLVMPSAKVTGYKRLVIGSLNATQSTASNATLDRGPLKVS